MAPILDSISCPADLRSLDYSELDALSVEIREFIVSSVSKAGGHLGSNLGVVELTLALHRVFDSPNDILLWDTGHQAYVHKMVTGRTANFESLRKEGGLSGYPSRAESEHDWIENSHASTVLSYAHGLATAQAVTGSKQRRIVAVIGDGSMTGGMAFEGLNNLGHAGSDVTIVLNDNGRSYAPTVSMLSESLVRIRSNPVYMRRQVRMERIAQNIPWVGEQVERGIGATKAAIRELWEPTTFFENLGVRYLGPFDGHDVEGLEQALKDAKRFSGPTVVHVLTQKGRGYAPAEDDPIKNMHDMGSVKDGSYTAAFSEALIKQAENHPEVVAITAAMPDSTGLLPFKQRFPDRFFDVGIAEQHGVTACAGMAMGGLRPVFALYSTFLTRAIDQVNLDVGLHELPVIFCLDRAGITGDDGPSHHGILDMVLLSKVPGMTIFAPSSYQELQVMLEDAVELCDGPAALRWSKTKSVEVPPDEVGSGFTARKARSGGSDICLIGVGKMLADCLDAAELLAAEGIDATVWDPRVVKPLDPAMITDAAAHRFVLTAEDGLRSGGIGDAIRDQVCDSGSNARVKVIGVPVSYVPQGKAETILADLGLNAEGIAAEVRHLLA